MLITKDLIVPLYTINEALSFWDRERVINMSYSQGIQLQEGGSPELLLRLFALLC